MVARHKSPRMMLLILSNFVINNVVISNVVLLTLNSAKSMVHKMVLKDRGH